MRVLVTGGAGFVGSHVAACYDEQDVSVTALDNLSRTGMLDHAERAVIQQLKTGSISKNAILTSTS